MENKKVIKILEEQLKCLKEYKEPSGICIEEIEAYTQAIKTLKELNPQS